MTVDPALGRHRGSGLEGHDVSALRAALAASGIGTWQWDASTGVVGWDETHEALAGLAPGSFRSTYDAWLRTVHPDDRDSVVALVDAAICRGGGPYRFEHRVIWPDGTVRWLEGRGVMLTDAGGEPSGAIGCAIDVTERKRADADRRTLLTHSQELADRFDRLQRIGGRLAGAVSVADVGQTVMDLLGTPGTAAPRGLLLAGADTFDLVAAVGLADETAEAFANVPLDADLPIAAAFREQRTILWSSTSEAASRYADQAGVAHSTYGFAAVPLVVGDRCLGVVMVSHDTPRLADLDRAFVEAAADHLAQALARIELSAARSDRAREIAAVAARERRRREQLEFLSKLTSAALAADDHQDLMGTITAAAVPQLGDWCSLFFLPEQGAMMETAVSHADPDTIGGAERLGERLPYDPGITGMTGVAAVMRTGESELIAEVDQQPADPGVARATRDELAARSIPGGLQLTSVITVPLQTKRGIIGAMQFVTAGSGRRYDEDDLALAQAVAGRAADALDNLWLTERHRHTAVTLQEALLPPALPVIPGIDVAARYLPAGATAQVGGDFYDVFPLGDQTFAVFIGDVCGSGPDAAAVTSIARHTARAAARHGHCHQEVLRWVNDAVRQSDRGLFCTASFSTIELHHGTWRLRTACAGHPLPIRRMAGGGTETIGAPGTLLGVFDRITTTPAELVLDPGDVILFYTDGITDLPDPYGITPDDMLELVDRLAVHETADEIANGLHSSVNARIADAWRDDDIALIVLRVDHLAAS